MFRIKHTLKKLLIEFSRVTIIASVLFFAGINLGFNSGHRSQMNKEIWREICFNLVDEQFKPLIDSGLNPNPNILSEENEEKNNSDFSIPLFDAIPDSGENLNPDSLFNPTDSTFVTLPDSLLPDSLKQITANDTLKIITKVNEDSLRLVAWSKDSTARLEHFRYQRIDLPYVQLSPKKSSGFFIEPSPNYRTRKINIDSTGKFVEIHELIAGQKTKIILKMPIEEYIEERMSAEERKTWEELGYAYQLKSGKVGLQELIKNITDFEIPLPKVGVLSIFGEPKISLKIGGAVQIHGAWRNETTEGVTASRLGNTRNEPDFKQQVQINVNGTIGDKLNIVADWNTERTFEYENQLKIKYTGYEDEIIQSIEAGNVSLQTSPLVGGSEALFGIKALFKMGPFSLTTIASQKKGETKEVEVSGGTTAVDFEKRAYDYSTNHYFLDTVYASRTLNLFGDYYGNPTPIVNSNFYVTEVQVWKSIQVISTDKSKERDANAYIDLTPIRRNEQYPQTLRDPLPSPTPGEQEAGRFLLLTEGVDYTLHAETGFITFKTAINDNDVIAVSYGRENGPGTADDDYFGEWLAPGDTNTTKRLVLKLVKPRNLQPQYDIAWKLLLKNIYSTGVRNINEEGFEFQIEYEIEGQEPVREIGSTRLLNAFGLDLLDASKQSNPDNLFDFRPNITVFPETGEVIFPFLEPFGQDLPSSLNYQQYSYQTIYDTTKTFAQQDKLKDKWRLVGKSTGSSSAVYQLGFNVVENSVKVILDGRELKEGSDYTVDYNIGQLTIRNDAALVPGANLRITFEQNDLFQLASKTLLGARGIYEFSKKTKLGFSILNLNQQTLSDKVRIGEEPLSNTIYGLDFSTTGDLPFLTKAIDNVFSTREMSTFTFSGEYAYIDPDPNTKKSTIISDGGQSIAYIDDFEGAKRIIPIGVSYTSWKDISPPDSLPLLSGLNKAERLPYKGKSFWFTETPSNVTVDQIYGDRKKVARSDQQVTVMDFVFVPDTPGTYNTEPILSEPQKNWGGAMKLLSSTANNLIEENVEFIEFWMQIWEAEPDAKLYLDLGKVSEDVIPNNLLDTEDKDFNDAIDTEGNEDTGLDGIFDEQERIQFNSTKSDPSGDNFFFQRGSAPYPFEYFNINGTQGNAVLTDIGQIPDTEDLNRNGNLDNTNSYFRFEIPLDTTSANPFIAGGGLTDQNWYLFRVPLKDFKEDIGSASLSNVEFIRMFITGVQQNVHFRITEFNLVGSQWQKLLPQDTVMSISVVSLEENPEYESPPGVFQERDRTRPDEDILRNEQALNLIFNGLPDGEERQAVKYLFRPLDVFNYKSMKLFIHGDTSNVSGNLAYNDTLGSQFQYSSEVYFRFGGDTNNYYEYRQPILGDWNEITINFSEITAIKQQLRDSISQIIKIPVEGRRGHFYLLKGNPTLTSVKFLSVGVLNLNDGFNQGSLDGQVWINELRVVGADDSPGWAYSVSSAVKFADLMTVNFNLNEKNPYFHKLAERFGSRVENRNWSIATDFNVLKLIPISLPESNLRINYTHTEQIGKPLYIPGTDVRVDQAVEQQRELFTNDTTGLVKSPEQLRQETETETISDTWSASNVKIKIPTKWWLIRDTFNAISFGFNYNKSTSRSPTIERSNQWVWNANVSYGLNLSPDYHIMPVDIPVLGTLFALFKDYSNTKIYFVPQNFSLNVTAKRNKNSSKSRPSFNPQTGQFTVPEEVVSRDFVTTRGFSFNWKITEGGFFNLTTNYNLNISSSLAYLETDIMGKQRPESDIWSDILSDAFFGRDFRYQQTLDFRTAPKLPTLFDINKFFTITAGYSVGYQWNFDFRQEVLGRSAGFTNKSNVGVTLRLKALFDPLFKEETVNPKGDIQTQNKRERNLTDFKPETNLDSTLQVINSDVKDSLTVEDANKPSVITRALGFLKSAAKWIFFDYESITFNFTNDNSLSKSGLKANGTGFNNFWGIIYNEDAGPTRGFMFGLSDDVGPRVAQPNTNLSDVFSQKNNIEFKTSRPLWEGAKIDLNWKVGWSLNKNATLSVDENGDIFVSNLASSGTLSRSYLSFPPVLFLSIAKSGITRVNELYDPGSPDAAGSLSNAFIEGFESFPIFSNFGFLSEVTKYIPRPNWRLTWDGLENFLIFKSIAKKVSLDHGYTSTYTEGWKLSREGNEEIQTQKIEYGFTPLAGLNLTFGQLWGGNLSGSLKYNARTSYDLGVTTNNITETFSKDLGFTLQYSKSGFEIPLFGVSLKNDIEFSLAYTQTRNSVVRYDMNNFTEEGIPQDGTTRVTIEPRIKYTISAKVTLSIFYKRSTVEPEGASRIPPTTTNEAGLDVNISIN